ncbi:MAG: MFS transporter, partial [Bacillota bacterium]
STLMLLSGAGGSLVGGQVGDRGDRTVIILISSASTAALIAVLLGVPLPTLPLVLLLILTGFSHSLARPCLNALTSGAAPAGKMGSVFGLVFGVMSLGGSISTPWSDTWRTGTLSRWALPSSPASFLPSVC